MILRAVLSTASDIFRLWRKTDARAQQPCKRSGKAKYDGGHPPVDSQHRSPGVACDQELTSHDAGAKAEPPAVHGAETGTSADADCLAHGSVAGETCANEEEAPTVDLDSSTDSGVNVRARANSGGDEEASSCAAADKKPSAGHEAETGGTARSCFEGRPATAKTNGRRRTDDDSAARDRKAAKSPAIGDCESHARRRAVKGDTNPQQDCSGQRRPQPAPWRPQWLSAYALRNNPKLLFSIALAFALGCLLRYVAMRAGHFLGIW